MPPEYNQPNFLSSQIGDTGSNSNPYLEDFEFYLRASKNGRDEQYYHPWLSYREQLSAKILNNEPPIPEYVPDSLLPHPADRKLTLTSYDQFSETTRVVIPDSMYVEGCLKQSEFYLNLANHRARIWAMQQLEERGFQSPPELPTGVIDTELIAGRVVQLADLGQSNGTLNTQDKRERIQQLVSDIEFLMGVSPEDMEGSEELQKAQSRVTLAIERIPSQAHRTDLIANGPFTLIGGKAFSFIGGGANPDIFGTVKAGQTAAKMGMMFGVPEVGEFADVNKQIMLAKAILEGLTMDDPILEGRSKSEREYIVQHWRSAVTGVLEGSKKKALERSAALKEVGVTSFRIYQHTPGREVLYALEALNEKLPKEKNPNRILIASQITNEEVMYLCQFLGADAVITGMGSGGRCTTALQAQSIPNNAEMSWRTRGKLKIPIIGEGGAIDNSVVAMLSGFSMANGCGTFGGTLETEGIYALTDDTEDTLHPILWYPYDGEASPSMKLRTETDRIKRTLRTGEPFSPEGGESRKYLTRMSESMTKKIFDTWIRLNMGLVVLGIDNGPFSISVAQALNPSPLVLNTLAGVAAQDLH